MKNQNQYKNILDKFICNTKFIPLFVMLLISQMVLAQTSENKNSIQSEAEFWYGISVEKKINKKWNIGLEENLRLNESGRQFGTLLFETHLSYKLSKKLRLKAAYRYSFKKASSSNVQRLSIAANRKWKINKRWRLSHRLKYQYDFTPNRQETRKLLRYKSEVTYNIRKSKWNPFFSAECFYRFYYKGNHFERYRLAIGGDYKWHKRQAFSFAYMQERDLNENVREITNILNVAYSFDF